MYEFKSAWNFMQKAVHQTAINKGWWDEPRNDGELIALMHSELSEALEALRAGNPPDKHIPELTSVSVELADVVIRIMDYAESRDFDISTAIQKKMEFNEGRSIRHGGKKF